jgi:hypothetical protein
MHMRINKPRQQKRTRCRRRRLDLCNPSVSNVDNAGISALGEDIHNLAGGGGNGG